MRTSGLTHLVAASGANVALLAALVLAFARLAAVPFTARWIVVLALIALYFVGAEQGATSVVGGTMLHEFLHDGRHLLGFPCH